MPLQDPFPTLEVGPFYCTYEDDRWDEPEIIIDPLTGFVVAILPRRSVWPEPREPRLAPLWRAKLSRWLRLVSGSALRGRNRSLPSGSRPVAPW
jgi:hypothetical protein